MAQKFVPYTFRVSEVIEPTRVNENARTLANEFNGNLDRENLREEAIASSMIVDQSCNLVGHRKNVSRTTEQIFGGASPTGSVRQMAFRTFMSEDFQLKHDAMLICSYSFRFTWVDAADASGDYEGTTAGNDGEVDLTTNTDRHSVIFTLRVNGIEVDRSANHTFFRKDDSIFLSGAQPVSAGTVNIDCQVKIVDHTTDHEFYIAQTDDVLNFKFKKR